MGYIYSVTQEGNIILDRYKVVYEGTAQNHRITRLQPNTMYMFRVCCTNESGKGDWSNPTKFVTAEPLPSAPKGLVHYTTHVAQCFDRRNIEGFSTKLTIHQFPIVHLLQVA